MQLCATTARPLPIMSLQMPYMHGLLHMTVYMQHLSANKHQTIIYVPHIEIKAVTSAYTPSLLGHIGAVSQYSAFVHNKSPHSREVDKVAVHVWCSCLCPSNYQQLPARYANEWHFGGFNLCRFSLVDCPACDQHIHM